MIERSRQEGCLTSIAKVFDLYFPSNSSKKNSLETPWVWTSHTLSQQIGNCEQTGSNLYQWFQFEDKKVQWAAWGETSDTEAVKDLKSNECFRLLTTRWQFSSENQILHMHTRVHMHTTELKTGVFLQCSQDRTVFFSMHEYCFFFLHLSKGWSFRDCHLHFYG